MAMSLLGIVGTVISVRYLVKNYRYYLNLEGK